MQTLSQRRNAEGVSVTPSPRPTHWEIIDGYREKYRYWRSVALLLGAIGAMGWLVVIYFVTVH